VPGEDLEGYAGLFGKLPATGDFVARGLPETFRARWDAWVTHHLARLPEPWPEGGLRFLLLSGGRAAFGLVLPSRDAVGRRFPLSALAVASEPPPWPAAEAWCDAALPPLRAACHGALGADALWAALTALPRPAGTAFGPQAPLLLWTAGRPPLAAPPGDPREALSVLLSSRGSPSP
jgi:type VI secretion system protein ImpM